MKAAIKEKVSIVEIGPNPPTIAGGEASLDRVLASGVTAVIAYNDLVAIGLLRAAQARGLKVPQELSIIGIDNIFGSDFTNPPLTTVQLPLLQLGRDAINMLLELLDKDREQVPLHRSELKTSLLVRGSTAKPKA
jgi:LacI family transcriptional regulator